MPYDRHRSSLSYIGCSHRQVLDDQCGLGRAFPDDDDDDDLVHVCTVPFQKALPESSLPEVSHF